MLLNLIETAVAECGGVRIGLANVWNESFTGDDGRQRQGVRGTICFMFDDSTEDRDVRVAFGDEVEVSGTRFQVVGISEGEQRGSLTLEQVQGDARNRC